MARKKWGQHWLASDELAAALVRLVAPQSGDLFVEIGPGRGRLTRALLEHPVRVVAVEVDPDCCAALRPLEADGRLRVIQADILQADTSLPWSSGPLRLVGNLPYNVGGAILRWTSRRAADLVDAHYMLQEEVAERVVADPGSRTYGLLSVAMQASFRPQIVKRLSPGAFRPPPAVRSAFLQLERRQAEGEAVPDTWLPVAEAAFAHRRKTLANALALARWDASEVRIACSRAGVDGDLRAEALGVDDYQRLAAALGVT